MKGLSTILAGILAVGYPLIVYFGLQQYGSRALAVVLLVFVGVRFFMLWPPTPLQTLGSMVIGVFSLGIIALDSELLLRFYPVVLSLSIASYFFFSLWSDKTVIEYFAEKMGETITPLARHYMRRLTVWWVGMLLINATLSAYTAVYASLAQWTLYNGLLSYLFFGTFVVIEWFYRQHYKRTHGVST